MTLLNTIVVVAVGLLSIAAGGAKLALVPQEVAFLSQFGFTELIIRVFGCLQVLGGLLMLLPATRLHGAVISAVGFGLSVILVFLSGDMMFAAVSFIPFALTIWIAVKTSGHKSSA